MINRLHRLVYFSKNIYYVLRSGFPLRLAFLCEIINIENIPKSTKFGHPIGIVIKHNVCFGENCTIMHGVTIGKKLLQEEEQTNIGNNVFIGCGSIILGKINIGDNAVIGAGAIVLKDVPSNCVVVGIWK